MSAGGKVKHIFIELKRHAPFTLVGAALGIAFMLVFRNIGQAGSHVLFAVFHPAHVVLSAMVTASMFKLHAKGKSFLIVLVVGYVGSIGIATLSDIIIPQIGANVLGLNVPTHGELHHHEQEATEEGEAVDDEEHGRGGEEGEHAGGFHLGFIEEWYVVNPAAILGVVIAYFLPRTRFPHSGHVLISTWASSSYLLMHTVSSLSVGSAAGVLATLFLATWLPCCISDIVFPLLLVRGDVETGGTTF